MWCACMSVCERERVRACVCLWCVCVCVCVRERERERERESVCVSVCVYICGGEKRAPRRFRPRDHSGEGNSSQWSSCEAFYPMFLTLLRFVVAVGPAEEQRAARDPRGNGAEASAATTAAAAATGAEEVRGLCVRRQLRRLFGQKVRSINSRFSGVFKQQDAESLAK